MDVHLPSADQAVLLREVVVELEVEERRRPDWMASRAFQNGLVLVATAADRADRPPVGEDQHFRAGALRC